MKFFIKNTFMSLSGNSKVTSEDGELAYKVKGKFFSNIITKTYKKIIKDVNNKTLFVVRNKFWHAPFRKSAIIFRNGKKLAVVQNSHLIKNGYEVAGATEDIKVEGTGWNLDIMLGDKIIGKIMPSGKLTLDDSYCVDVFDEQDAPFLVAMMIAIDNIHDQQKKR